MANLTAPSHQQRTGACSSGDPLNVQSGCTVQMNHDSDKPESAAMEYDTSVTLDVDFESALAIKTSDSSDYVEICTQSVDGDESSEAISNNINIVDNSNTDSSDVQFSGIPVHKESSISNIIEIRPKIIQSAKRPLETDASVLLNKQSRKDFNTHDIKEEALDFNMMSADGYTNFDDIGIEVTNADFMEAFDKSLGDISAMFRKLDNDPFNQVECTVCFKKIKESSMKQHFRTHAGLRPHPCDICGTRFTRKGDVYRHKRVVHRKVKPYTCRKCDRTFPDRNILITHLQNHDKTTYYECDVCGYKFGKKEYYESHILYIHPLPEGAIPMHAKADVTEVQLKELEEEISLEGIMTLKESKSIDKASKKSELENNYPKNDDCDEEEIDDLIEETCNVINSIDQVTCNSLNGKTVDASRSVPSVLLQTVSNAEGEEENLVNKILDAAVAQSTSTLESLRAANEKRKSNKSKSNIKELLRRKPLELVVKASISGSLRRFLIQLQLEDDIDVQSTTGMQLVLNLVKQMCKGKGELDGPIEVELFNPGRVLPSSVL